ncbi:response regulator [Desulfuromonas sp. TF]|uniref:response regulator n=1 Tax=Desulfuromonas sp. TF TaxID=1232410 RepID=UPI00042013CB|nr:response regulator [Desulfuromonas sp. TF]
MDREEKPSEEPFVILLVEDNPAHAEMVKRALEGHPVANRIIHLTNGEAALDFLFRRGVFADPEKSPRPHVVLLDLRLPRIDGLEVLREIRTSAVLEKLPVVILTTSEAEIDAARAYEHHANSFLVKPLDFDKFIRLMEDLGFYWLKWNYYPWA